MRDPFSHIYISIHFFCIFQNVYYFVFNYSDFFGIDALTMFNIHRPSIFLMGQTYSFLVYNLPTDARREARKALLAFSCDDAKTHLPDSEPVESSRESFLEHPVNDDVRSSQSTPVWILCS